MQELIYAFCVSPDPQESGALILARSIRELGGKLADYPIWALIPQDADSLSDATKEELIALNVRLIPLEAQQEVLDFPFAGKVFAFAHAESLAEVQGELLACLDTDMIVLREPGEFLLPPGKSLGYRPVHHKLIGSDFDEPIDDFWSLVYAHCSVQEDNVFPMITHVGKDKIRPYFNAGMLVVRPEKKLIQLWRDNFDLYYRNPVYEAFYQQHALYRVFIHQAILTGSILSALPQSEMQELSDLINYPLHLIDEDTPDHRPSSINALITCRYETFFQDPDWENRVPATGALKNWIFEQFRVREEK